MQSGISASAELQSAFNDFLSSSSQRGLIVGISSNPEQLVPRHSIQSTSQDFSEDLSNLTPHVKDNEAMYIILRQHDSGASKAAGTCVAITYVPDKAPVRQKMLFASTRLTLVRELGTEHFASTLFANSPADLTPSGWSKHLAHESLSAPLTREEADLAGIREAEARESMGTTTRRGGHASGSSSVALPLDGAAQDALAKLAAGELGLVVLGIDIARETLVLDTTAATGTGAGEVVRHISGSAPRYSFFAYDPAAQGKVLFIYTCPGTSKIKERMLYAASKNSVTSITAPEAGLTVEKKMEAGGPEDLEGDVIAREIGVSSSTAAEGGDGEASAGAPGSMGTAGAGRGFARPKRPGRK